MISYFSPLLRQRNAYQIHGAYKHKNDIVIINICDTDNRASFLYRLQPVIFVAFNTTLQTTIIFCRLYYFLVTIAIFFNWNQKKMSSENCNFTKSFFARQNDPKPYSALVAYGWPLIKRNFLAGGCG